MLKNTNSNRSGFTLVELLIVIVVIAILAVISIVAYNGIQQRGKTSAAAAAAETVQKKAEAANAIASSYPAALTDFSAQQDSSLSGSGISTAAGTAGATMVYTTTPPAGPNTILYGKCTAGNTTSAQIVYWNYTNNAANAPIIIGNNSPACTTFTPMAAGGPY